MKLENQVCSLELAKKLKKLGVKQESLFYWIKGRMSYGYEGEWSIEDYSGYFIFSHSVGYKPNNYDFEIDAGNMGETEEEYKQYQKREKKEISRRQKEVFSAFTVAELINKIYQGKKIVIEIYQNAGEYIVISYGFDNFHGDTLADAVAKMLIYLLENKLLEA